MIWKALFQLSYHHKNRIHCTLITSNNYVIYFNATATTARSCLDSCWSARSYWKTLLADGQLYKSCCITVGQLGVQVAGVSVSSWSARRCWLANFECRGWLATYWLARSCWSTRIAAGQLGGTGQL